MFLLNLATFLIFGALTLPIVPFFVSLASVLGGMLVFVWVAIVLISLSTLPITGAVAVAARPCCGACGHRFWPGSAVAGGAGEARFPIRIAVVGGLVLLVVLGIGLVRLAGIPGRETWTVTEVIGSRIILSMLVLGVGLLA